MLSNKYVRIALIVVLVIVLYDLVVTLARSVADGTGAALPALEQSRQLG